MTTTTLDRFSATHLAQSTGGSDTLVVVSQRGPVTLELSDGAGLRAQPGSGGLVSALGALAEGRSIRWVAGARSPADQLFARQARPWRHRTADVWFVDLPAEVQEQHYAAFANPLLWFVQHNLADRLLHLRDRERIARAWEEGYGPANELIAGQASRAAPDGNAVFLVQDYQLYLVPGVLRRRHPDATIGHFTHIPWPEPDAWKTIPRSIVASLLRGLLGADVVGFQTAPDAERFVATCAAYLPSSIRAADGAVAFGGRRTLVRHYPITIDERELDRSASTAAVAGYRRDLARHQRPDVQTIVRVDRLDPSKNIPAGFQAFRRLLEDEPRWRGRVRFRAHLVPSRGDVPEYQVTRRAVYAAAAEVNRRFGTAAWQPIEIVEEENRSRALTLLEAADVLLVNSVADGMNLVAKEGAILNRRDGVLVLSRRAGAWAELAPWALSVDPDDIVGTAAALGQALAMPADERRRRAGGLRRAVRRSSLDGWLEDQLRDLGVQRTAAPRRAS
jgi:trehalose 6-phosphate synthase